MEYETQSLERRVLCDPFLQRDNSRLEFQRDLSGKDVEGLEDKDATVCQSDDIFAALTLMINYAADLMGGAADGLFLQSPELCVPIQWPSDELRERPSSLSVPQSVQRRS